MSEGTCAWDGCDRVGLNRGLCDRCYMRAKRAGVLDAFARLAKVCEHCEVTFHVTSSRSRYCSAECQVRDATARRSARRRRRLEGRVCRVCGGAIPLRARSDAQCCSTECQQKAWYEDNHVALKVRAATWKATHRQIALEAEHRRRARKLAVRCERIDVQEVWARDAGICWICERPVDPAAGPKDPMRRSLDHIIPLSRGGWHAMDNVALAHLRCNISKRSRILDRLPAWHPGGGDFDALAAQPA